MDNIITSEETKSRVYEKLGAGAPSVFDKINRSEYSSDDDYLDACTRLSLEIESKEFMSRRASLAAHYRKIQIEEERKKQAEDLEGLKTKIRKEGIGSYELEKIRKAAHDRASEDLAKGKINTAQFADRLSKYENELSEDHISKKASAALFNNLIRSSR